ncbi:MAG: hypothetical protein M3069_03665 [Chloroflexota bacterium]|nr:hypothetical protein [Chloroflexota bacterium]
MTDPLNQHMRTSARASTVRQAEDVYTAGARPYPDGAGDDTGPEPDRESPPSTPRWVKAFGIGVVVLLLLFAGLHLTGNAPTHMPGGTAPEHGVQAP